MNTRYQFIFFLINFHVPTYVFIVNMYDIRMLVYMCEYLFV